MGYNITNINGDLAIGRNAEIGCDADIHGKARVAGSLKVEGFLDAPNIKGVVKGLFVTEEELNREYPNPRPGWCAIVLADDESGFLYLAKSRKWEKQSEEAKPFKFIADSINVFASKSALAEETERAMNKEAVLQRDIENEATRATEAENNIKSKALQTDTVCFSQGTRGVSLGGRSIDGKSVVDELIPVATTEMPGAMSPEDKVQILNNKKDIENTNIGIEELKTVLADGSFVVGIASLANAVKAGAVTFEMLDGKLQLSVSVVDDLETANTLRPLSANQGKILKELIDIINGTGEGSTDKKITDAIAKLVNSAPENLDTLRELAEWTAEHGAEFAAVVADIKNDALLTSSVHVSQYAEKINIGGRSLDGANTMSVDIPAATTEEAGVMSAEQVKTLQTYGENLARLNTTILNYNRKIGDYAPVDKATVVANLGTAVERGMVVTYYSTDGWKSIRYISSQATAEAFANVDNWEDFSAEDKKTLDCITSLQFINNDELSSLPEDRFIKSDLDFEVIESAYIDTKGRIIKNATDDSGNIIIIKPKSSTQYIHIKSRLSGRNCVLLGHADTVSAANVKPLIQTTTNTDEVINANWYIKPVTYLYVYVGHNTPTLESIDGFNAVPIPTVEQVSDITSDITSIFRTLPLAQEPLPFTYLNGYIDKSGKVMIDNTFSYSLAVFDLEGISRVKIKVRSVVSESYTTATFSNTLTPTSNSSFSPIIRTPAGVVTEIVTDVVNRYLFVYVGENSLGASEMEVSKISITPTELVSKNELLKVENNISNSLNKKVDKKLGDNLFDKDSPEILYDTLLSSQNVTLQPDYAKTFCVTPYIAIEEGKNYIANYSSGDVAIYLCVVDATRSTVLLSINKTTGPEYKFTAPEGAAYVRMTLPMSKKDTFIFNEGTEVIQDAYYEDKPVYHSEYNPNIVMPWKGKTIAMYGDSITELCGNTTVGPTSWGGYLISALNAKGIVRGWGGTPLRHSGWDNSTPGSNRYWFNSVGEKVAVGTEGGIEINVAGMCDWKRIITQFPETIKDTIDAVILMGGTNDFRYSEIGNVEYTLRDSVPEVTTGIDVDWIESEYYTGGDFDVTKIQGAVCSAILKLQTWMPNAIIIIATQLSGYWPTQGENGTHQLVSDKSGLTEGEFALKIAEAARYMSVPVIDINGLTGINQWNRTRFITDNVHPYSDAGKKAMARVFIGEMTRIRPNF